MHGSPLTPETRKIVVQLKEYFDRIRDDDEERVLPSVTKVAHALDLGISTVKRIMADYNRDPDLLDKGAITRGHPEHVLPDALQSIIRESIRQANQEGRYITQDMLRTHLESQYSGKKLNIRTLGRALDRWGFTYGKGVRSQHLKEKEHVIAARHRYLRRKRKNRYNRTTHRPEVYLDETYINKNHSNDFTWYLEEDGPLVQKPTGKGERLIIINAITQNGWVADAKLTFKSTRKTGDYHGQMNHDLFMKWFKEKLLPNIPNNSLIIMDNAPYHSVLSSHSAPTANCKKERIIDWLEKNKVPVPSDCLKPELVEILSKIAPEPTFAIDEVAADQGHEILRTPPYHPELQPIETCWGVVKNEVARNCDFTMLNLQVQLEKAFSKVTTDTCSGLIGKVQKIEDNFWESDALLDEKMNL